jgi:C-terminal processing protease CtpA/Prc
MRLLANFVLLSSLTGLVACGFPGNELTAEERKADMSWAFTVLEHNYAPAELKKSNFGVEMSQVKADCMTMSEEDISNEEFLALFQKCIHTFKDAHLGAQQMNNGLLPENANVAHLGFVTMRTKADMGGTMVEALKVVAQLKGSDVAWAPVVPGDIILKADGLPVDQVMKADIVPYINVGQDETNLSMAAFRFGVRTSIDMALPEAEDITLTVKRGESVFDIKIPWIKEDMLAFQLKQQPPEEEGGEGVPSDVVPSAKKVFASNPLAQTFFGYNSLKEVFGALQSPLDYAVNRIEAIATMGFRMARFNPLMNALFSGDLDKEGEFKLKLMSRILPMAGSVDDLMDEPLIPAKIVTTDDGKTYAYIQISSFPAEDAFLLEWHRAITAIEDKGVKSVIIDMLDNGGGSLLHGMRMANMMRKVPLNVPSMQVKLNNNWMNSFKTQAAFGADDYTKTIASRVVKKLEADKAAGKSISRPLEATVLDPFFLQSSEYGMASDVKVALLVNEFCISMCDIFASVFQDNNMGVIIGQKTMGGGGNVTQHGISPVSKIGMAVTESLMLSPNGKYIEDNGVEADIEVDMVLDREQGFPKAFNQAYLYVTDQLNVAPVTN